MCIPTSVGPIDEKLFVKTDNPDKNGTVQVVALCEEAILDMSQISSINFGVCTVFDLVSKTVSLGNLGKFPLKFELIALFPLRAEPEGMC
jgi:hypothetical protein